MPILSSPRVAGVLACAAVLAVAPQVRAQETAAADTGAARAAGLSLRPERKVRITTNEGSWMSVDVSPDGRQLVFDLLGDLYLLPIEGGQARRLTGDAKERCVVSCLATTRLADLVPE